MSNRFNNMPVSKMTFMLYTGVNDDDKNRIYKVLKKRLPKGCSIEELMYCETEAFDKRGTDINKYLFQDKPSAQLLMELYFTYIHNKVRELGVLSFSEVMLCNQESKNKFFDKFIRKELKNIKKRIDAGSFDFKYQTDEILTLKEVYKALAKRYNYNPCGWEEDSLVWCIEQLVTTQSSLLSEERQKKDEERMMKKSMESGKEKFSLLDFIRYGFIYENDYIDIFNEKLAANRELRVLSAQRHSIFASMDKPIDYSFITEQNIMRIIKMQ